jgi:hypothetical protein
VLKSYRIWQISDDHFRWRVSARAISPALQVAEVRSLSRLVAIAEQRPHRAAAQRSDSVEVLANNLKAAAKKVNNSAARVEVALIPLMTV